MLTIEIQDLAGRWTIIILQQLPLLNLMVKVKLNNTKWFIIH